MYLGPVYSSASAGWCLSRARLFPRRGLRVQGAPGANVRRFATSPRMET